MAEVVSFFDSLLLVSEYRCAEMTHEVGISRRSDNMPVREIKGWDLQNEKASHRQILYAEKSRLRLLKRDFNLAGWAAIEFGGRGLSYMPTS